MPAPPAVIDGVLMRAGVIDDEVDASSAGTAASIVTELPNSRARWR